MLKIVKYKVVLLLIFQLILLSACSNQQPKEITNEQNIIAYYSRLINYCDWINLITYDYGNTDKLIVTHNSPFKFMEKDYNMFKKVIPPNKIVLGFASYGYLYEKVKGFNIGMQCSKYLRHQQMKIPCFKLRFLENHKIT